MFDFSVGKYSLFIKIFPVWIYTGVESEFVHIEVGIFNVCLRSSLSIDWEVWDD